MSEFYMGQVMMTGFKFPPKYFAGCNGAILPIAQNQALFALLGTMYGGNGVQTFALPDLRGRAAFGALTSVDPNWSPASVQQGGAFGSEQVALTQPNLPAHAHLLGATSTAATLPAPSNGALLGTASNEVYAPAGPGMVPMAPQTVQPSGSGIPHPNMQPYEVINFNIALNGIFPSRN